MCKQNLHYTGICNMKGLSGTEDLDHGLLEVIKDFHILVSSK